MEEHINDIIVEFIDDLNLKPHHITLEDNQIKLFRQISHFYYEYKESHKLFEDILIDETIDDVEEEEKNLKELYEHCLTRFIHKEYLEPISKEITRMAQIEVPEQRTPEWYQQRRKYITASEAAYAMSLCGEYQMQNTIFKKLGIYMSSGTGDACIHGILLESATIMIYETRFQVKISEYGCLPHPTVSYLAASPDGIITNVEDPHNLGQVSKAYRMIEIKNPYSRKIDGDVKREYYIQMQLQMQVAQLPLCEFVETDINKQAYQNMHEMLNDTLDFNDEKKLESIKIANKHIPLCNLASDGKEKGITIHFFKDADRPGGRSSNIGITYPINNSYDIASIREWLNIQRDIYILDGYTFITMYCWKLSDICVQVVERDDNYWNADMQPKLAKTWEQVVILRPLSDEQLVDKFENKLMLDTTLELDMMTKRQVRRITQQEKMQFKKDAELNRINNITRKLEDAVDQIDKQNTWFGKHTNGEIVRVNLQQMTAETDFQIKRVEKSKAKKANFKPYGNYQKAKVYTFD